MEYSIQEVARAAGTTSRTLRHYDAIGLVAPSRVGHNGYRYYDDRCLVRLQRVLLLRELGLGLDAIAQVLEAQDAQAGAGAERGESPERAEASILRSHLDLLRAEQQRLEAQIGSVERTIEALTAPTAAAAAGAVNTERESLMSKNPFDGFDHTRYREEVEQRWGAEAYATSDRWWRGLGEQGQSDFKQRVAQLNADWIAAAERGDEPESPVAQELAQRHVDWLRSVPGAPSGDAFAQYVIGLGEMYVADERFAANYGGTPGASLVRDALRRYAERELS